MCHFYIDKKLNYKTFTVPCEKSKTVSLVSSIIKSIFVFPALPRFAVKLICWIAYGSASRACCLLKSIAVILKWSLKQE